jgi:hypothetical protein
MRRRASFHRNSARRLSCKELQDRSPAQSLSKHDCASGIRSVHLKHFFGQIQTNRANLAHGRLPLGDLNTPPWHIDAVAGASTPSLPRLAATLDPARLFRSVQLGRHESIHHALHVKCRERAQREASPHGAIIDSQSVKSSEWLRRPQEDQGQEAAYSRRHARAVDARHRACRRHRDGGALLRATLFSLYPFLLKLSADGGYQGGFQNALPTIPKRVSVEIVKCSDQAQLLPKRWIIKRTFGLGRCRRLAEDWECLDRKALAFLKLASILLMLRKSQKLVKASFLRVLCSANSKFPVPVRRIPCFSITNSLFLWEEFPVSLR